MKIFKNKVIYTVLLFSSLLFSSSSNAAGVTTFHVERATSAWHNSILPPLPNANAALNLLTWDVVPGSSSAKQSLWQHGGGWLAFVLYSGGNTASSINFNHNWLNANYNGTTAIHFDTYFSGTIRQDIYYGPFAPNHLFKATLPSFFGGFWASMTIN
jgi:hypothetical protein